MKTLQTKRTKLNMHEARLDINTHLAGGRTQILAAIDKKTYPEQKVKGKHQIFDARVTTSERHFSYRIVIPLAGYSQKQFQSFPRT